VKYFPFAASFLFALASVPPAPAQIRPVIGIIDSYGTKSYSTEKLAKALSVREGDPLPPSKFDLEQMLLAMKGITRANVESLCCEQGKAIFYIGIEERGALHLELREYPANEELELPESVVAVHDRLIQALADAARANETAEDWRLGYSLIAHVPAQVIQLQLPDIVDKHQSVLRRVLRESADPDDRTIAATLLGYGPKVQGLVDDLQFALRDPEQPVRGAALRSLAPLALYSLKNKQSGLRVPTTWFVEMLNSFAWQDRMNAMNLLLELTASRDPYLMRHIRERGVGALEEMALWKHLPHALPAFLLLGRAAGLEDPDIQAAWSTGEREAAIKKWRKLLKP
jgi:hypothetical protein